MLVVPPLLAEEFTPLGDGADTNNVDLLRDDTTGCENCTDYPPGDFNEPYFNIDWQLALRGSYVQATSGSYLEAVAAPSVTLRRDTLRGGFEVSADAEVVHSTIDDLRLSAVGARFDGDYQLDAVSAAGATLELSLSQDSPNAPGTPPTVAIQPLVLAGNGEVRASRQFGQFVVSGRGNAGRTVYGPTTLVDSSTIDNNDQSNWTAGGGLRLGYRFTPVLTAFIDGSAGVQQYDAVSPIYLVKLDAVDYQARAGLSASWTSVLEAEASIGYGLRRFADPGLGEVAALLYDASVTFRPDETIEARGSVGTNFGAPGAGSPGTARLETTIDGDVAYVVNPWLRLRAGAGWSQASFVGTPDSETSYRAGAGADYLLNEHSTLTADYGFTHRESTMAAPETAHRVTLGITFSR